MSDLPLSKSARMAHERAAKTQNTAFVFWIGAGVLAVLAFAKSIPALFVVAVLLLGCGFIYFQRWQKVPKGHALAQNAIDYHAGQELARRLRACSPSTALFEASIKARTVESSGWRLGEVVRAFDTTTQSAITGFLTHNLGFHGFGGSMGVGDMSLGVGRLGLSGSSTVEMTGESRGRQELTGDGFIAVLERPGTASGSVDTLRLVAPAESVCREQVFECLASLAEGLPKGSHRSNAVATLGPQVAAAFPTETSYVGDRLGAALRLRSDERPTVSVIGADIGNHALLGAALRFDNEDQWHSLYPLGLILKARELARESATGQIIRATS